MKKNKVLFAVTFILCGFMSMHAQNINDTTKNINVHGTIRGKYEYQTNEKSGRFLVRNARVSVEGNEKKRVYYKAEIDLSDEGKIKMLDVFTRLKILDNLTFAIGHMRAPFTIDAHRSPHLQYFANRSFIAKQVGNVRDVGAMLGYDLKGKVPFKFEAGIFNGSGITNQKDFWTNSINYSAKLQLSLPFNIGIMLSTQKTKPLKYNIMMYDFAANVKINRLYIEGEYLYKQYEDNAFKDVHAVNTFINYDIPINNNFFSMVSPRVRYDFMTDHSDGLLYINGKEDNNGQLIINDFKRSRITTGVSLKINDMPKIEGVELDCDIRINYEKYFYSTDAVIKPSENDKFVVEFVTRF